MSRLLFFHLFAYAKKAFLMDSNTPDALRYDRKAFVCGQKTSNSIIRASARRFDL